MSLESIFKLSLIMNMVDNLTGPMARISTQVNDSVSGLDRMSQSFGNAAKAGAAMAGIGAGITAAALAPVKATFETRRALGELGSLGVQELGKVEDAARSFSDQWAGTTKSDFIAAAYDIKSGIATLSDEGVAGFTSIAALTSKATKSTAAEMTSLFATGYGIYKDYYGELSDMEFGEMFSAGISQSVKQFKTTGSGMAQSIQTLGAAATTAQVPLEEQLSVLGMLQATMGGSEAGTKYKAFLRSAAKGGEALGLSFTDANNQLLSMPEILDVLRGRFGETMDAAEKMDLQKAFGDTEAVALIDLMYSKVGDLQSNIAGMYDSLGAGTSIAHDMASAIQETEPERFALLHQRIQNVKESIGNSLLPTINSLMDTGERVTASVGSWIDKNQELVRIIMIVVLGLGGFLLVAGSIVAVFSGIGLIVTKTIGAFKLLKAGFLLAKGALLPLITSVWSFTAALLANPVTWIVIGIIALIAAIVLLYNKCEWFRNFVNGIIDFFKEKLGAALEVVKSIFGAIGDVIGKVMGAAKATVDEKLGNMKRAYEEHGGGIRGAAAAAVEGVKGIFTGGYTFLDNLTGGKLSAMKDTVVQKLGDMKTTYEEHGGGIRGIAAAAMEGVKSVYTTGFTAIDNITGGKLSLIKDKFLGGVTAIRDGVGAKISEVGAKFSQGIQTIKNNVSNAVGWFFESGKKVVTTFASGIRNAFSSAVNAVKNGLQKIRNMLPFSDAKEGPLSTLTLSGQRVMTTFASGVTRAQDAPADAVERGLSGARAALSRPATPARRREDAAGGRDTGTGKQIIIQKLIVNADIAKIKDLPALLRLVEELMDGNNSTNGDEDPEPQLA